MLLSKIPNLNFSREDFLKYYESGDSSEKDRIINLGRSVLD